MAPIMLPPLVMVLVMANGQDVSYGNELEVLSEADQQLVKQVQDMRRFINVQLIEAIEVINGKAEENRRQIQNLAEMTQKSLQQISQKVNQNSDQLGQSEELADVALPLLGAAVAEGQAEEDEKIEQLAHVTKLLRVQQDMDGKLEKMLNRSHLRVNHEIAQLKAQVTETNQRLQRLQRRDAQASRQAESSDLLAFRYEASEMQQLEEAQSQSSKRIDYLEAVLFLTFLVFAFHTCGVQRCLARSPRSASMPLLAPDVDSPTSQNSWAVV